MLQQLLSGRQAAAVVVKLTLRGFDQNANFGKCLSHYYLCICLFICEVAGLLMNIYMNCKKARL